MTPNFQAKVSKRASNLHSERKRRSSEQSLLCHPAAIRLVRASKFSRRCSRFRTTKKMKTLTMVNRTSQSKDPMNRRQKWIRKQKRALTAPRKQLEWNKSWAQPSPVKLLTVIANLKRISCKSIIICMIDLEKRGKNWWFCCIRENSSSKTKRSSPSQIMNFSRPSNPNFRRTNLWTSTKKTTPNSWRREIK